MKKTGVEGQGSVRVLLVGFSVTADFKTGYVSRLRQRLGAMDGVTLDVVGIGGIHPNNLVYLIDEILSKGDYHHVMLEISTSSFRKLVRDDVDLVWPIIYILDRLRRKSIAVGILHLYRGDVNFSSDRFIELSGRISSIYGVPEYNIGRSVHQAGLGGRFLVDDVHVNAEGSDYYADHVSDALTDLISRDSGVRDKNPLVFSNKIFEHLPAKSLVVGNAIARHRIFERSGYGVEYIEIATGEVWNFSLCGSDIFEMQGFSFVSGPRSGGAEMLFSRSGRRKKYQLFDEHSYYERFVTQMTSIEFPGDIRVITLGDMPTVVLKKGAPSPESRVNGLVGFLCANSSLTEVRGRVSAVLGRTIGLQQ